MTDTSVVGADIDLDLPPRKEEHYGRFMRYLLRLRQLGLRPAPPPCPADGYRAKMVGLLETRERMRIR